METEIEEEKRGKRVADFESEIMGNCRNFGGIGYNLD